MSVYKDPQVYRKKTLKTSGKLNQEYIKKGVIKICRLIWCEQPRAASPQFKIETRPAPRTGGRAHSSELVSSLHPSTRHFELSCAAQVRAGAGGGGGGGGVSPTQIIAQYFHQLLLQMTPPAPAPCWWPAHTLQTHTSGEATWRNI